MLELLGFIALIAIIFGVSMTAAVGIIVKAILWIIGVCVAFAIVGKMQASTAKTLAWIAVIAGGVLLAGLDAFQNTTYAPCFNLNTNALGWEVYADCMSGAAKTVEARTSTSIWLIVVGVVLFIAAWVKGGSKNVVVNDHKNVNNIQKENATQIKQKLQPRQSVEDEKIRLIKEVDIPTQRIMSRISLYYCVFFALVGGMFFLLRYYIIPDTEEMTSVNEVISIVLATGLFIFFALFPLGVYFSIRYKQSKKIIKEYGCKGRARIRKAKIVVKKDATAIKKEDLECDKSWEQIDVKKVGQEPWRKKKLPKNIYSLIECWQSELYAGFKDWIQTYYAKSVSIVFTYDGKKYEITAKDLNVPDAYLEPEIGNIAMDLKKMNCKNVEMFGFLD